MDKEMLQYFDSIKSEIHELKRDLFKIKLLLEPSASQSSQFTNLIDNHTVVIKFCISKKSLYTLRKNGTLPYTRLQNKILYKLSDLQSIIDKNYVKAQKNQNLSSHE